MDASDLHRRARQAFEATSISQAEVARTLGLNRSSVSQALRGAGLRHPAVQARILSLLENEPVQRRSTYRAASVQHEWILGPQHWRVGGGYPWVRSHRGRGPDSSASMLRPWTLPYMSSLVRAWVVANCWATPVWLSPCSRT
jgi:transcriptional regulator with XRE-family HTH domain